MSTSEKNTLLFEKLIGNSLKDVKRKKTEKHTVFEVLNNFLRWFKTKWYQNPVNPRIYKVYAFPENPYYSYYLILKETKRDPTIIQSRLY